MFTDYILNGQGHGEIGRAMADVRFDAGLRRPFLNDKGDPCVTINTGRFKVNEDTGKIEPTYQTVLVSDAVYRGIMPPLQNATSLRKDDWIQLDRKIQKATRQRLTAYADARAVDTFSIPGMSRTILEWERMQDTGEAIVDMDGLSEGTADSPNFQLEALPLPITHSDFHFSERQLAVSRNSGTPLDSVQAEQAGRRIGEMIEKTIIGEVAGLQYGDGSGIYGVNSGATPKVYGYKNHPDRITKTDLTAPDGTNPATTLAEVLAMKDLATAQGFFGPYMLYTTDDWDQYMDNDYATGTFAQGYTAGGTTLRERLRKIEGIMDVKRLDFWSDTTALLLVQMTSEVVRAVSGMEVTTMRWDAVGGMRRNFKVMAIQVPNIRSQYVGVGSSTSKAGIVHATTS
jgi:hypothetical protein